VTAIPVNVPPYALPLVGPDGRVTAAWQWWFAQMYDRSGGTVDKVDAASATASAAAPRTTQVVAGGGLQIGGDLGANVALALYVIKTTVADLPTDGVDEGDWAYALDGRKSGEASGSGTGVPVWWSTPGGVGGWYTGAGARVTS
jgi:hypothetical protein